MHHRIKVWLSFVIEIGTSSNKCACINQLSHEKKRIDIRGTLTSSVSDERIRIEFEGKYENVGIEYKKEI